MAQTGQRSAESAREQEIEITPEMIDAGIEVLVTSGLADDHLRADRYRVAEIFRAMHQARRAISR